MPEAIMQEETDFIVEEGEIQKRVHVMTGIHYGENANRKSEVTWLDNPTVTHLLEEIVYEANVSAGWVFDLVRPEQVQYTTYTKDGEYEWHIDGNIDRYAAKHLIPTALTVMPLNKTTNPLLAGLVRKLSVTVNLSSPEDYEGGTLELLFNGAKHEFPNPPYGSAVVFPSFVTHRITPVTKGVRKSAVMWFNGPPIR